MKRVLGCLSMAALAIVLAAPVSAQTITLKASVPFDFTIGGRIMPAGDYVVSTAGDPRVLEVRNVAKGIAPAFATINAGNGPSDGDGASLTFNRYRGDYFLTGIWDSSTIGGCSVPMSRTEREKAKSASPATPEVVLILARR